MSKSFKHRGFNVYREGNAWKWIYEDYDGAPDSSTRNWFGTSNSREQAIEDIDEIVDDVAMIEKISRNFYKSGVITKLGYYRVVRVSWWLDLPFYTKWSYNIKHLFLTTRNLLHRNHTRLMTS